jgi:hypothetical protein
MVEISFILAGWQGLPYCLPVLVIGGSLGYDRKGLDFIHIDHDGDQVEHYLF